jgi:response regulator of citrate/malate metabolism
MTSTDKQGALYVEDGKLVVRFPSGAEFRMPHDEPGAKREGTSRAAARGMKQIQHTLQMKCYLALTSRSMTADEVADSVGVTEFSCRPRITELMAKNLIEDSGLRRMNKSGRMATVWRLKK